MATEKGLKMDDPLALSTVIAGCIVFFSSVWVQHDADVNKISTNDKPYGFMNGSLAWFIVCILLWIIFFPMYLFKRSRVLRERREAALPPAVPVAFGKPATSTTVPQIDIEQEIRKLGRLKQDGLITEADFDHKKKQILGLGSVVAPTAQQANPETPKSSKGLGCVAVIVLCVLIGWVLNNAGYNPTVSQNPGPKLMSKAEWKAKLASRIQIFNGNIYTTVTTFKNITGSPDRTQTVGNDAYWYYECSDGTIQVVLNAGALNQGTALGSINDY